MGFREQGGTVREILKTCYKRRTISRKETFMYRDWKLSAKADKDWYISGWK